MKVILPLAGLGSRMRPHTWSKPKPLLNVAGKAVLGHVLDAVEPVGIDEVVFIIGWLGDQIKAWVGENYDFPARYVVQPALRGQAHAIYLAKEYLSGPCLIIFVDTVFEADITGLDTSGADIVGYVQEVEDPRRFGVAVEKDGVVERLIEKPDSFEHKNAVVGVYYVADGAKLVEAIEVLLEQDIQTKGEYYLADALNVMMDRGAKMITRQVAVWEDCGVPDTVLHTNQYLLASGHAKAPTRVTNSVIIPPVHVPDSAVIENSVVGPDVTLGENVVVRDAVIRDSIVEEDSTIEAVALEHTLIGRRAKIQGSVKQLNAGDDDVIQVG